jgi:hypothetical protein
MWIARNLRRNMQAATFRADRTSIRLTDAVHIATVQPLSCRFFVSHDRRPPDA